jgi:hypothetical protein
VGGNKSFEKLSVGLFDRPLGISEVGVYTLTEANRLEVEVSLSVIPKKYLWQVL